MDIHTMIHIAAVILAPVSILAISAGLKHGVHPASISFNAAATLFLVIATTVSVLRHGFL